jgi:hypothetical protein
MQKNPSACEVRQLIWTRLDFNAWFGKSTFESALAEIIRREHSGTPSFSLLVRALTQKCKFEPRLTYKDVLQGIAALYAGAVSNALNKDRDARSGYMDFYRYIHHVRCCSDNSEWEAFFRRLLSCIASSCNILKHNSAPVPRNTRPSRLDHDIGYLGRTQAGRAYSQSSSQYDTEPPSPPETPTSSSSLQSVSRVPPSSVNISNGTDLSKYTTVLQEHVDVQGGSLECTYKNLSVTPSVWHCLVSWDGITASGTGRYKQEGKNAASQQMCQSLGLDAY